MTYFSTPFSFIASHPLHDGMPVIIDRDGNIIAMFVVPPVAPEHLEEATRELAKVGVAMAEALK